MVLSILLLLVAVTSSSAYNPTPTNTNGGDSGSTYPQSYHSASYTRPINGNGSQSS
jgi:hypothetical protein